MELLLQPLVELHIHDNTSGGLSNDIVRTKFLLEPASCSGQPGRHGDLRVGSRRNRLSSLHGEIGSKRLEQDGCLPTTFRRVLGRRPERSDPIGGGIGLSPRRWIANYELAGRCAEDVVVPEIPYTVTE